MGGEATPRSDNAQVGAPQANVAITTPIGQQPMAQSVSVVVASNQTPLDVALPPDAATETTLAGVLTTAAFQARINTFGQKNSASSTPVVLPSDQIVAVQQGDSPSVDASGRLRVSLPYSESEISFQYDLNPLFIETVTSGGATVTHESASCTALMTISTGGPTVGVGTVTVGTGAAGTENERTATFTDSQTFSAGDIFEANGVPYYVVAGATSVSHAVYGTSSAAAGSSFTKWGSHAVVRQRQRNLYQKGKSQYPKCTFVLPAAVDETCFRAGYYALKNGYYIERRMTGGVVTISLVERSASSGAFVETSVPQASWNLDPLDGSGPSGITLNLEKQQIFLLDAQFLGAGRVRCGFDIGGKFIEVHAWDHANETSPGPYMQYFSLPITYELFNIAASAGTAARAICLAVDSEGGSGTPPQTYTFAAYNTANVGTSTARTHLLSIRPKQTFGGRLNSVIASPGEVSFLSGNQPSLVEVLYDCTLTGGAWVSANANSALEYNLGATVSAAGVVMHAFFVASGQGTTRGSGQSRINGSFPLVLNMFGVAAKALTIAATATTGTPDCRAAVEWEEWR